MVFQLPDQFRKMGKRTKLFLKIERLPNGSVVVENNQPVPRKWGLFGIRFRIELMFLVNDAYLVGLYYFGDFVSR